jgi:hypothetical protein
MKMILKLKQFTLIVAILALSSCNPRVQALGGQQSTPIPSPISSRAAATLPGPTASSPAPAASATPGPAATIAPLPVSTLAAVQVSPCASSTPASAAYKATLCLTAPANDSTISSDVTVSSAVTTTGKDPGIERMVFNLNGSYLLTDYQAPFTFTLPTPDWSDGAYVLSATAYLRDGFTTSPASIVLHLQNGAASAGSSQVFSPSSGTLPQNGKPFVVVAAGDGASGERSSAIVVDLIASLNPNLFLYLGDVYEKGTSTEFYNWYGPSGTGFGRFRPITDPTIGNHEYTSGSPQGYFQYWDQIPDYYSFNAGGWHFISLNANSSYVGVDRQSPQYQWLATDLAGAASSCTIVFYHQPLFNIGPEGPAKDMADIWALLAKNKVAIVLNGHDHDYQRWVPLDALGQPTSAGVTEFIAGGGGHGLQTILGKDPRVAFSDDLNPDTFGALKLVLNPGGAVFSYINSAGAVLDSGVVPCTKAGADTQPPTPPTDVTVDATNPSHVTLAWQPSTDNTGVKGYTVYRNGQSIGMVSDGSLTYVDTTALQNTHYQYTVDAFDLADNHSAPSDTMAVTLPRMLTSLKIDAEADTYVNAATPELNFGSASSLRVDANPNVNAYLRFNVTGLAGASISRALLLVYANNSSDLGIRLQAVVNNGWDEHAITYKNAPALGSVIASSGSMMSTGWVTFDVTAYITQEGAYNFGISTVSPSALSLQSRESGADTPQLILDLKP